MPRAGLTPVRVVAEAEVVADAVGLDRLTLAAVAGRLGVRIPSLYKHVDGIDGLRREIAVRAKTELGQAMARAAVGKAREDALTALAHAYRRWAKAYPGRYAATIRAPAPGDVDDEVASATAVQVVYDVLAGFGLSGVDSVDATRALRATLHGFVALESAGGFGLPVDVDRSFDRVVDGLVTAMSHWGSMAA